MTDQSAWVLIGLFFWLGLCILANAVIQRNQKIERLRKLLAEERAEHLLTKTELDTALQRDEAKRSHECLIRDQEIERKDRELQAVKAKNRFLENALKNYWPGAKEEEKP